MARSRLLPDNFTLALLGTVALASILPATGSMGALLEHATVGVVALLFFMHGAKLSRQAVLAGILRIMVQLMLPFAAGHLLRPWIGGFMGRHAAALKYVDQGSVLLVVYTAFSAAVAGGLWQLLPLPALAGLLVVCAVILGLALTFTTWLSRRLGFAREDEITIVFCGSKKSLVSGVPIAKVLFDSEAAGAIVLPPMVFHQMQLMVCAVLAQRYARQGRAATVAAQG